MPNIDRAYVMVALLLLVAGELLGFYMGATNDLSVRDSHVALMLPGFVVLTLYGVLYRLWPAMKDSRLAMAQFWFAVTGALGLVIAAYMIAIGAGIIAAVIASVLTIIGAALMAWLFWTKTAM
jgi:hypothetical protein